MQNPDWDDLRVFLTVDRAGSLAAAARALSVNHSTVLRRLNRLEADLAVRLFEHLPTGYTLTAAGETLRDRLRGVDEEISAAQRQLSGLDTALTGVIRITTTDTLARGLLTERLAAFHAEHAGIELQLVVNNRFSSLTKRDADVALRGANDPPGHFVGRLAGRLETALYASRAYWRAHRQIREPAAHAWVAPDESLSHLAQSRWVATHVADERVALRVDSLSAMVEAVRSGIGVGFLLCFLGERERDLVRVADPMAILDTQLWILTHPDLRRVARIRAFTEFLCGSLQKDVHVLPPRQKP